MESSSQPIENIAEALRSAYPELDTVRDAATDPVYVVGGAVRDLLLGRGRADLDLVVEGNAVALAAKLGDDDHVSHERFATAKVVLDGHELDIASARSETYPHPGALPVVAPANSVEEDLGRRDFTINAMALPLRGEVRLLDPHRGRDDLQAGLIRVLHDRSFVDDPTRALRAARYAARFGFGLAPETARLLAATDLDTLSADRQRAELLRLAAEPTAPSGFELLSAWGLVELREGGVELAKRVGELLASPPWLGWVEPQEAVLAAAVGPVGGESALAATRPPRPSEGFELARRRDPVELSLARAEGAEWLDDYLSKWRVVELEIAGEDLIAAGVPQGPAVGRGLQATLNAKLDGEVSNREQELALALEVARST